MNLTLPRNLSPRIGAAAPHSPGYPAASATAHLLEELALYGVRPGDDEPDHRPLPEPETCAAAVADMVDVLSGMFADTRLEDDLEDLLWSFVNLFHRKIDRVQRQLDDNEGAQRRGQKEQDGSEVKAVELERLVAQGLTLIERRNAFEFLREAAAEQFEACTGSTWRPRSGSRSGNGAKLTAAYIDSRDFLDAERRRKSERLLPEGPRIAFSGGLDCNDHTSIWAVLDAARQKHPGMVLLHTGAAKGADHIAAKWAETRGVAQVAFKPDWSRKKQAAWERNDQLLATLPTGLILFPGNGIQDNLADKARKLGIRIADYRSRT